jgi:DNA polymerase-1
MNAEKKFSTDCSVQIRATPCNPGVTEKLLIVDGHCYAYRAFYAIRQLKSPDGRPTNAIYGFIKMVERMRAAVNPSSVIVLWDGGLDDERTALLPEYKAQRAEMPDALREQLDGIVSYLKAAGIASWMKAGVEADDSIATLTARAVQNGYSVVIASADKDFMQLVAPQVRLLLPGNDAEQAMVGPDEVVAKTGVRPEQIVDWLSLIGDAVDNIRGVEGVGPKTAAAVLSEFGTIERLFERMSEVTPEKLRGRLESSRDVILRNQKMIRLKSEIGCDVDLDGLRSSGGDVGRLKSLYEEWGFKSMLRELAQTRGETGDLFAGKAGTCSA